MAVKRGPAPKAAAKAAAKGAPSRRSRSSDSSSGESGASDDEVEHFTAGALRASGGAMSGAANLGTPGSPASPPPRTPSRSRAPPNPKEAERVQAVINAHPDALRALTAKDLPEHPSMRNDIINHPVIAFCEKCATDPDSRRRQCHLYYVRAKALMAHMKEFHSDDAAPAPAAKPDSGVESKKDQLRATVIHWAVKHRIGERALRDMYSAFGEYISCSPLSNHARAFVSLPKGLIATTANRSNAAVLKALNDSPFLAMSVDGGRWSHRGVYMMVFVAHTPTEYYVLRPVSSATAFDGEKIAEVWMSVAGQLKRPVHHVMADGCTANVAAFKGVRIVAKLLARAEFANAPADDDDSESDVLTDDDVEDGAVPDHEEHDEEGAGVAATAKLAPSASIFDHLCASIVKSCPAGTITRAPMRLMCLPHWLKCRVLKAHRAMDPKVILAVTLLTRALHSPHGPSVRREQLKNFLQRILRDHETAKSVIIPEVCSAIDSLIEQLHDVGLYCDGAKALVCETVVKLLPWAPLLHVYDETLTADSVAKLTSDTPGLIDKLKKVKAALQQVQSSLPGPKQTVTLATANETRWHSSLYVAFVFLLKYLAPIRDFFGDEKHQTSESAVSLFQLLNSKTDFDLLQQTLDDYVRTLEPVATLLKKISDVSSARLLAHRVYGLFSNLKGELSRMQLTSAGYAVWQEIRSKEVDDEDFEATMTFYWHVQLFDPHMGAVVRKGDRFIAMTNDGQMSAACVRAVLNFTAEEFPDDEWAAWLQKTVPDARDFKDNPVLFWDLESIQHSFPKLRLVAQYLLSLPVSVTSCDSALSVMGSMFDATHNRLQPDAAAATLALRCNGDVTKSTVKPSSFPPWTKPKPKKSTTK